MADAVAVGAQLADEIGDDAKGLIEGRKIGQLRADVDIDAADPEAGQVRGLGEGGAGAGDGDAELILSFAGGDFRVGLGIDIGIDAQRDRRDAAHRAGELRQGVQFRL